MWLTICPFLKHSMVPNFWFPLNPLVTFLATLAPSPLDLSADLPSLLTRLPPWPHLAQERSGSGPGKDMALADAWHTVLLSRGKASYSRTFQYQTTFPKEKDQVILIKSYFRKKKTS